MSTKADEAVAHLLMRIRRDPRLAYYFDPYLGESMKLLTEAHAEANSLNLEDFRREYYASLSYERPTGPDCNCKACHPQRRLIALSAELRPGSDGD